MEVAILYNKANHFGLQQDVQMLKEALKRSAPGVRIREADPLEPPVAVDLAIHLEIPVYGWMPWSSVNILLCNTEWYETAWNAYLPHFDGLLFRCQNDRERFLAQDLSGLRVDSWCVPWACPTVTPTPSKTKEGYVWFLGGSKNKREAAQALLPLWNSSHSPVTVYTTSPLDLSGTLAPTVSLVVKDLDPEERKRIAAEYRAHLCFSKAESFGYAAAEAEAHGAFLVTNNLDVYQQDYGSSPTTLLIDVVKREVGLASMADFTTVSDALVTQLTTQLSSLPADTYEKQTQSSEQRRQRFYKAFSTLYQDLNLLLSKAKSKSTILPPVLKPEECPPISVVTLLYNRRKFFDLACHNIMLSDYPKDKIEWVIVEDSDDPNEAASDRVIQVGMKSSPLTVVYAPLEKKTPISEKRNIGCKRAKNDIILFMDDDDHYPETSFRRRVSWLLKHPWKPRAVGCTTIACYDLVRGVSAVNTPPWNLPLGQRLSEATLCFYKKWWDERHFTFKQEIAEGEDFVTGREKEFLELPPQQIIVAFSHTKNVSGRRIPSEDAKPGCFWGFPKEFLVYIHKLAGIEVEEDTA